MSTTAVHPLDMVTPDEIRLAAEIIRADPRFEAGSVFVHVRLYEPAKDADAGTVDREIEALLVPPDARLEAIEVIVSVSAREIRSWTVQEGARPALLFGESLQAMLGVQDHPDWQAALRRRGIEDSTQVQIDPWPAGSFGVAHEEGRRISRCIAYWRESPSDNGYARPIEGLIAFFDQGAGKVLEVVDLGVVPMPPEQRLVLPRRCRTDARRPPSGSRSSSPTVRASTSTGTTCAGSDGRSGWASTRTRVWCCTPSATTTATACGRCSIGRRCARWSSRTATRARCTGGRTRSTPASGASVAWRTR